ncbi:hypothetical protein [Mycobacterium sp.]|uniref:hypothetical protein n=1 Tax=Mycobacterium sp. TaxID=1785 RepID=UPI0025E73EC8|nr:hypothetical protein [Mycobacterium sp.]
MRLLSGLAAATILTGAAISVAGPASAEPLDGPYTHTITDKSGGPFHIGGQTPWILSPCGSTCLRIHQAADPEWDADVHLEGKTWAGPINAHRTISFDKDTLVGKEVLTKDDGEVYNVGFTLTKA